MSRNLNSFILFICFISFVQCLDREMTINVDPGKEDCFYQHVKQGDIIDVDFQVIDGGHGDLDITFHIVDHTGRILIADYKKSENNHRVEAAVSGDYRFCFDNTFSSYNSKTVFFELIVDGPDDDNSSEWGVNALEPEEVYDLKIEDIKESIETVRNAITKAKRLQELIKSSEARDRNIAEENNFMVSTYSMVQIIIMLFVGGVQVLMVRSLFDDSSKVHTIWKTFNGR